MTLNTINQSQQTNIYDPLPDGAYTRVLILEPGRRRQPLRCRLKVVNLEERPDFEAISYVWGRGIKRKKVICNGICVKITPNLLQALMAVRYPSRQRIVWADSISINQDDNKEKGRQVTLMGPIYNRARRVLIHLVGDDRGHAHQVATFVSETLALVHQMRSDKLSAVPNPSIEDEIKLSMKDPRLQSLKYLLDHTWFQRGWVIQEALLAQDTVVIWGSQRSAGLKSLLICHNWLLESLWGLDAFVKYNINPVDVLSHLYPYRFREGFQRISPSLPGILAMARSLKVKDPRDRVYAFLYLDRLEEHLDITLDAASMLSIQPDYSKPATEVYADFARYMAKRGNITWLHHAENTQKSLVESRYSSWIPRWDTTVLCPLVSTSNLHGHAGMYPSHHTSDNRQQEIARFDGNCLIVPGVIFDQVRACHSSAGAGGITLDEVASFWRMAKTFKLGHAYSPEYLGLALLDTLTRCRYWGPWTEWLKEREVFWDFLRAAEEGLDTIGSFGPRIPNVELRLSTQTWGRKLISTEKGYFGLAPRITEENDVTCIIFGCCFPFILREVETPTVSKPQRYRVVGDAWVAGKQAFTHSEGVISMPEFGGERSMEWETWGLKEGDITLI